MPPRRWSPLRSVRCWATRHDDLPVHDDEVGYGGLCLRCGRFKSKGRRWD